MYSPRKLKGWQLFRAARILPWNKDTLFITRRKFNISNFVNSPHMHVVDNCIFSLSSGYTTYFINLLRFSTVSLIRATLIRKQFGFWSCSLSSSYQNWYVLLPHVFLHVPTAFGGLCTRQQWIKSNVPGRVGGRCITQCLDFARHALLGSNSVSQVNKAFAHMTYHISLAR